jgi:GTP-binding protein EngB required for normal cell division
MTAAGFAAGVKPLTILTICCYRFAKSSKGLKIQWLDFTQQYFIDRDALVSVLLLVDSSVPPQQVCGVGDCLAL